MEILQELEPLLRTFWYVAIPVSVIFLIQTIMTFIGADGTDGTEVDFDGDLGETNAPFQLFSLRNLINFLLGFSWTGISFYNTIANKNLLIGFALLIGILFVLLFFAIISQVKKLAEDNSFKLTDCLNQIGEVYLNIPANKTGKGKILISIHGSMRELDAITHNDSIKSGAIVKVIAIESDNLLLVEPS